MRLNATEIKLSSRRPRDFRSENHVKDVPMRDIFDKMERHRIIGRAEDWSYIRELRNSVSHDYPMMANEYYQCADKESGNLA